MLGAAKFSVLAEYVDAYNIDLKSGSPERYASIGGDLDLILENIRTAVKRDRHVELTTLVVPRFNDTDEDIRTIVGLIKKIDPAIPFHITRFFPAGEMKDEAPTDRDLLYRFRDIAKESLEYVFLGNI